MTINFKKPQTALPLIVLPFLLIFFYAYRSLAKNKSAPQTSSLQSSDSLQGSIAQVSDQVKSQPLASKLSAYRQQYRGGDGYTAIKQLHEDQLQQYRFDELYSNQEKLQLDSIEKALKKQNAAATGQDTDLWASAQNEQDIAVQQALAALSASSEPAKQQTPPEQEPPAPDPMELFRMQMAYADSMAKANDPELQQKLALLQQQEKQLNENKEAQPLPASKYNPAEKAFNTLRAEQHHTPIQAIIDQTITGTADSRIRIRLLDDLLIGEQHIARGTHLYARMSGFSAQRVLLSITSILSGETVLPVKLEVYDNDGGKGLYVPASAFREFSKELGGNSTQGITLQQQAAENSQMVMSVLQRMFQSTSSAVSKQIRKNKARIKYNTLVYLIDGTKKQ